MALDPLTAGFDLAGKVLDKIFPDPAQRANAQLQLEQLQQAGDNAQITVDTEEAKSESVFVAGWRPFIGWVCGAAFAYHFIILPIMESLATVFGYKVVEPVFDMQELNTVLMGMLGLGGLRTIEKVSTSNSKLPWQK